MRIRGARPYRPPLWLYATMIYPAGFVIWAAQMYLAAWAAGGPRAGDAGFPHGTFSYPDALIGAAIYTAILTAGEKRRRTRASRAARSRSG